MSNLQRLFTIGLASSIAGCDPVFQVAGANFPSWLPCLIAGVIAAAVARPIFVRLGIEPYVGPLPLIYSSLALLVAMLVWIVFFNRI